MSSMRLKPASPAISAKKFCGLSVYPSRLALLLGPISWPLEDSSVEPVCGDGQSRSSGAVHLCYSQRDSPMCIFKRSKVSFGHYARILIRIIIPVLAF